MDPSTFNVRHVSGSASHGSLFLAVVSGNMNMWEDLVSFQEGLKGPTSVTAPSCVVDGRVLAMKPPPPGGAAGAIPASFEAGSSAQ